MSDPTRNGAEPTLGARTLELGGRAFTVERPTGLKAQRALAILRELSRATPQLQTELAAFRTRYESENVLELDRVQAKLRYPPRPITGEDGAVMLEDDGSPRMLPSPVDRLTEADWEAAGGLYRMPASPSMYEVAAALLDRALELAEDLVYRFLALFTISNGELKQARRGGNDAELVRERAEELLEDAYADELLELAVAVGETVDHHFRRKADTLGDRLAGFLRLLGIEWTPPRSEDPESTSPPSEERPSSSTDSPANTPDGPPTSSSTPPTTSSSSSPSSPESTESAAPSPITTPA